MTTQMQNAPAGDRGACEMNFGGFIRKRISAARRMEPFDCGHADHWLTPCHRPTLTAESVLASVVHLDGRGHWSKDDLRRAWTVATTDKERTILCAAAKEVAA